MHPRLASLFTLSFWKRNMKSLILVAYYAHFSLSLFRHELYEVWTNREADLKSLEKFWWSFFIFFSYKKTTFRNSASDQVNITFILRDKNRNILRRKDSLSIFLHAYLKGLSLLYLRVASLYKKQLVFCNIKGLGSDGFCCFSVCLF